MERQSKREQQSQNEYIRRREKECKYTDLQSFGNNSFDKGASNLKQYQDLSQYKNPKYFRGKNIFVVQLWWIVQSTFFALSPRFLYGWRRFILRLFGAKIGKGVLIRSSVKVTYPWKLSIGDFSWVGDDTVLYNLGQINIGKNVAIAHHVYLCTGIHDYQSISFDIAQKPIIIEDEVWLPNDVFVGPGVNIGKGCVIGARSTVLNSLPEGMICYGSPAKPIKERYINKVSS
jgi:putative colanic acid biosynthesis acetyltransferase WcaF